MLRNVFWKTLRDHWRSLLWWCVGAGLLALVTVLFYPSVSQFPEFEEIFADSPEALANLFTGGFTDLTSPAGYLNSQLFILLVPIVLLVFAIGYGGGAIAGEEDRGTLDLLLALPVTRAQALVQKFGAMVVLIAALGTALWAALVIGAVAVDMEIGAGRIAQATLSGVLLAIAYGALALAVGSATGKRGLAYGVAGAAGVVGYFLNALAPAIDVLTPLHPLSPFYYYIQANPLANGMNLAHAGALIAIAGVFLAVAWVTFDRRDLGVG